MCRISFTGGSCTSHVCNVLYIPGTSKRCPTVLGIPNTNVHTCGKRTRHTKGNFVVLRVNVRNVPIGLAKSICRQLCGNTLGGCRSFGVSGQSGCCCGQICANYIETVSFVCALPRFGNGLTAFKKDRNNTLSVMVTKLSTHIGKLISFCPTLYSVTNCTRNHTNN